MHIQSLSGKEQVAYFGSGRDERFERIIDIFYVAVHRSSVAPDIITVGKRGRGMNGLNALADIRKLLLQLFQKNFRFFRFELFVGLATVMFIGNGIEGVLPLFDLVIAHIGYGGQLVTVFALVLANPHGDHIGFRPTFLGVPVRVPDLLVIFKMVIVLVQVFEGARFQYKVDAERRYGTFEIVNSSAEGLPEVFLAH